MARFLLEGLDMELTLKVTDEEANLLKALIEEFWELQDAVGSTPTARLGAITWQHKLSYETPMDLAREQTIK